MIKKIPFISFICAVIYVIALKVIITVGLTSLQIPMLSAIVSVTIIAIPLYIGLLYIRKTCYFNSINFAQSFYAGILISVTTAFFVFSILSILELSTILIPDLILDNQKTSEAYIKNYKPSLEEIVSINKNTKNSTIPYAFAKIHFAMVLLISGFCATILSLFIRNKDTFNEIK
jgi:lysylphosphatidylglycerol synthetase-like protein (DUF2156 family)